MPIYRPTLRKRGRGFDWGFLKRWWDDNYKAIGNVTSKLVGPVATALTGVPIPNIGDLIDKKPEAVSAAMDIGNKAKDAIFKTVKERVSGKSVKGDNVARDISKILDMGLQPRAEPKKGKGFIKY